MGAPIPNFAHVNYLWDDEKVRKLSPAERLVYRSNLLGSDQRITNTGGGNTSAKLVERDPITTHPQLPRRAQRVRKRIWAAERLRDPEGGGVERSGPKV